MKRPLSCPLLGKKISEGRCYEINFERLNHLYSQVIEDIQDRLDCSKKELNILNQREDTLFKV